MNGSPNFHCGKIRYADAASAKASIRMIKKAGGKSLNWYQCRKCGSFHLTSWPKRVKRMPKRRICSGVNQ